MDIIYTFYEYLMLNNNNYKQYWINQTLKYFSLNNNILINNINNTYIKLINLIEYKLNVSSNKNTKNIKTAQQLRNERLKIKNMDFHQTSKNYSSINSLCHWKKELKNDTIIIMNQIMLETLSKRKLQYLYSFFNQFCQTNLKNVTNFLSTSGY